MSPFPSARVIHPRWSEHHRPVAAGAMTAECTITDGGTPGGWDPTTGPTPGTPGTAVYTGRCRVQGMETGEATADGAGQQITRRPYLVAIPADAPEVTLTARIRITACPGDPQLVGKVLTVGDVQYASERFERDLTCTLDLTNQEA